MTLYSSLLGSWDLDVIDHNPDGSRQLGKGEVHFAWVLEGRAIQDVWIVPPRGAERPGVPGPRNRYGTTLRIYDPRADVWHVNWFNAVTGRTNTLIGRRRGDQILQEGTDADGSLIRWTFSAITAESFHWRGEVSSDRGMTWCTATEFLARRMGTSPAGS